MRKDIEDIELVEILMSNTIMAFTIVIYPAAIELRNLKRNTSGTELVQREFLEFLNSSCSNNYSIAHDCIIIDRKLTKNSKTT